MSAPFTVSDPYPSGPSGKITRLFLILWSLRRYLAKCLFFKSLGGIDLIHIPEFFLFLSALFSGHFILSALTGCGNITGTHHNVLEY